MATRLVYQGSEDCEAIRISHSNKLQENATYRAARRVTEVGETIRIYLDKTGDGIQPGDPVMLRVYVAGEGYVQVTQDNYDNNLTGAPGKAEFIPYPARIEGEIQLTWPVEIEIKANPDLGYLAPGFTLRSRSQSPNYKPGMTDDLIRLDPFFASLYDAWLTKRADDWYFYNDYYPEPPEQYEREAAENNIIAELREYFSVQWADWMDVASAIERTEEGQYWSGTRENGDGAPIMRDYRFVWQPQLDPRLYHPDGVTEINPGGADTYTMLVKEFGDEGGDRANEFDWTEMLRVNFSGTPEPLTVECDDSNCPNHCIEIIRPEDKAWKCICSSDDLLEGTPIAPTPNRIERKPSPNAPAPPPRTLGQRKAKARALIDKLQPQHDQAKAKYKAHGDAAEAAHNLHRAQDVIAKDPTKPQADRDAAAEKSAEAVRDRDDEMLYANAAAKAMQDTKKGLDALRDFVGQNKAEEDSGISVGPAPHQSTGWRPPLIPGDGWRPPLVSGGNGWNNTPTYINNNAANPDRGTTQTLGPSGGIQAAQVQNPQQIGGDGFQAPQQIGGGGFVAGEWNATPTSIIETQEEIISQIITEE
jgi:hypothetical protein